MKFYFDSSKGSKEISTSVLYYAAMSMMTSQILNFVDFTKIQKSRYLGKKNIFASNKNSH